MNDHQDDRGRFLMLDQQDDREAAALARSEALLERADIALADQAERAQANKLARIMAPPVEASPVVFKRHDDAAVQPAGKFATRAEFDNLVRAVGEALGRRVGELHAQLKDLRKENGKLHAWIGQVQGQTEAVDRVASRVQADLATLRREVDLDKKIAAQNLKRRLDLVELENSLLKAGRSPDEALPGKLSEWHDAT